MISINSAVCKHKNNPAEKSCPKRKVFERPGQGRVAPLYLRTPRGSQSKLSSPYTFWSHTDFTIWMPQSPPPPSQKHLSKHGRRTVECPCPTPWCSNQTNIEFRCGMCPPYNGSCKSTFPEALEDEARSGLNQDNRLLRLVMRGF